ncbi:hypothetical protein ABT147_00515 [Streptomyces sp. NPDC001868]|uniref:hypothetical protein n=1 Tax=Streptomyces sp. NPDC001868 TaxID=3154401 RepID=UPI003317DE12
MYERIAAHNPSGAAEALFTHITAAWLVRRCAPGDLRAWIVSQSASQPVSQSASQPVSQ